MRAADDGGVALHHPPLSPRLPHIRRQSRSGEENLASHWSKVIS